jgi:hypothetical protein
MPFSRNLIGEFISKVEWATTSNVCYLLYGNSKKKEYAKVAAELNRMCKTRRRSDPVGGHGEGFPTRNAPFFIVGWK